MLFYLFSEAELRGILERLDYTLDEGAVDRNIAYYMQRTSHGSTLSHIVHSYVMANCDRRKSWEMFIRSLHSDISDIQGGTTPEGIHLGAMAGTVDLVERVYAGLEIRGDDVLRLEPSLPEEVNRLHLNIRFRGHALSVTITPDRLHVRDEAGVAGPISIRLDGQVHELPSGESLEVPIGP